MPIRIGDSQPSDHYGTCGHSGRYVVADSSLDGMERLELTDLWTGEMRTVAYISTPTEPAGKIDQDHGHPAGSPDGTKVLFHSCYDLVNHRLYAIPTQDIHAGDPVIPVETTEGFAPQGRLLIGHGYVGERTVVPYQSTDATHFYGCDWGSEAAERLNRAIKGNVIRKGSHHITDALGRLFPDGGCRPRKEYIAVVKRPDPPRALASLHTDEGVRLSWNPPASHREVAGYVVWRRSGEGPLERLTADPVAFCEYIDASPPRQGKLEYTVQAVEHSGLYGAHSGVAWVDGGQAGVALVDSYDIRGCAYVTPGDRPTHDRRRTRFSIPVEGLDWCWTKLASCRLSEGEHVVELACEETYDIKEGNLLKNPSFEDGLEGWTCDEGVTSVDDTRAHSGDRCVKLSGGLTGKRLFQSIDLEVKPEWSYRLSLWIRGRFTQSEAKRYNGPHPNTLGRIAMLLEPLPYPRDWYRNGNQFDDERWHEMEIVFDSPRQELGAPPAQSITAQPFWCPHFWGKQVGTVWIDDVTVTELGPRLRPVKATKLLVTNVDGYVPRGLDGRENLALSRVPLITVSGLRQTERTEDSVALAWEAGRTGTRGYNVYLNTGPNCPATKYHRYTSVWGGTTVTVDGLLPATDYAVKVRAINEDGMEGPAATVETGTGPGLQRAEKARWGQYLARSSPASSGQRVLTYSCTWALSIRRSLATAMNCIPCSARASAPSGSMQCMPVGVPTFLPAAITRWIISSWASSVGIVPSSARMHQRRSTGPMKMASHPGRL
ncbi:MAG: fibronectin type III domain-containing protein [Planctomycetes bacterium]|nr:fibronectin type III domain-containing protein [Planctomycetota bacterium]